MIFSSLKFRLTALFVAIFGFTLVVFSAILYERFISNQQVEFDRALVNLAVDMSQSIDVDFFGDLAIDRETVIGKKLPFALGQVLLQIRRMNGAVMVRSRNLGPAHLPLGAEDLKYLSANQSSLRTITLETPGTHSQEYRLLSKRVEHLAVEPILIQVAVPMTFLENQRRDLLAFFLISIPLVLLIAALGGWYLSRRALAPVAAIIDKTRALSAYRLSDRVPVPEVDDEMKQLALTLNDLLTRLQKAFQSQERFVADASHQLKTPLSILRGELDLIRRSQPTPFEIESFFESASEEIKYLSRMVEDLLLLARVDSGPELLTLKSVRLDEILLDSLARLEKFAQKKNIKLRFNLDENTKEDHDSYSILGDADLLQVLFQNLIENAVKFSPVDSTVDIYLRALSQDSLLRVEVIDRGPGIPKDKFEAIFEAFRRLESTQKKSESGVGLGLSIASRVAKLHQAKLWVESEVRLGSKFLFEIKNF